MKPTLVVQRGVTLIEMMLAATLIGLLGLAFVSVYAASNRYMVQDSTIVSSQGDAAFAADHIKRNIFAANQVVLYDASGNPTTNNALATHRAIAFRFDPNPLPGTPTDFTDDRWAGYQINGTAPNTTLDFYANIVQQQDPPLLAAFGSATEVVIRRVLLDGATTLSGATVPFVFELPGTTLVIVDVTVRKTAGADQRETHLRTTVSPRGAS